MKSVKWIYALAALAVVLITAMGIHEAGGAMAAPPKAEGVPIRIDNFSFNPQTVTVPVGTAVRWSNHDDVPHNVVSEDRSFKSKTLDTDEEFSHTFTRPGTYTYFCSIHPRMTATIVVH